MTALTAAAERQRRRRDRIRAGRRLVTVDVDEALIEDALVLAGLLDPADTDDPGKLDAALRVAIERWADGQVEAGITAVTRDAVGF